MILAERPESVGLIERPAPTDVAKRVIELNARGHPVLFPVRKGGVVHCLVAVGCSPAEAELHDPGDGSVRTEPWGVVMALWTGDIAYILTTQLQRSAG